VSMQYIRDTYGVPAKRGAKVRYTGDGGTRVGTIVASDGAYIRVRFPQAGIVSLHPTWKVEYLDESA
jgi:hypothetical protein